MSTGVPSNIILPTFGTSFDSSNATSGPAAMPVTGLIAGQGLATGTGTSYTKYLVSSADEVGGLAGLGSEAHRMAIGWFKENTQTTCYLVIEDDAATATAATVAITMGGTTASKSGEQTLYISGTRYVASVAVDDTFDEVAAALVTDVNDDDTCNWTAAYVTPTLTLTCDNKGIKCGDVDVRESANQGESTPPGITISIAAPTPGTVDPDVQDVLDVIGDSWFNVIAHGYTDETNLTAIEVFAEAQNDVLVQREGMWYSALRDTRANMITFGTNTNRNSQFISVYPAYKRQQSTSEIAAAIGAMAAKSVETDEAVPLHRITSQSLTPLDENDRWTKVERNQLALSGISTLSDNNGVQTEACVTMYLRNSAGASDTAYQQQNTVFQLMGLRYRWNNWLATRYPRAKLAATTEKLASGQKVMTPMVGKSESIAWFSFELSQGKVEDLPQFKRDLQVAIDDTNKNRINFWLPPNLMNQLIVGSSVIAFRG